MSSADVKVVESHREYASAGRRLIAGLADWMIAIAWGALVGLLAAIGFYLIFNPTHGLQIGAGLIYVFPPAVFLIITLTHVTTAFMISSKGASFGHRLVRLRIVGIDAKPITRRRGLVRQFVGSPLLLLYATPMFFLVTGSLVLTWFSALDYPVGRVANILGSIGFNWLRWGFVASVILVVANHVSMVFDSQGRGWHDIVTGTYVVRDRSG